MNNTLERRDVIDVNGLSKSFNGINALNNITLNIQAGCIFGFLGPNGSGKSTCLRLLCGLIAPDAGTGACFGFDLFKDRKRIQAEVGYMPQKFSLYQHLTVYENLDFIGRIYSLKDRKKKVQEVIDIFSLSERQHQLAHTLSGGWQQRLSLAAAILHEPRLLLLDEPTSGIDPHSRLLIWSFIQELAKKGVTVLVSTHHMDEAERCHELAYLSSGKILTHGSVDEVIRSAGLCTWRITGSKISELAPKLKKYHELLQIIEKGNEIRINARHSDAIEQLRSELLFEYEIKEIETSLEDVFIYKIQSEGQVA